MDIKGFFAERFYSSSPIYPRSNYVQPNKKQPSYFFNFSVNSGTLMNKSPTRPTSATWKIGASASLLIAAITLLSFIPARCCMAPDIPAQRYSSGATFLPVCPTCRLLSANPLSTAARDAPIAAPRASASGGISWSNCSLDFSPRPPETTLLAVARSGRSDLVRSSEIHSVTGSTLGSIPSVMSADPSSSSAAAKAVPRTVMILIWSVDWTVSSALPAYIGRTNALHHQFYTVFYEPQIIRTIFAFNSYDI